MKKTFLAAMAICAAMISCGTDKNTNAETTMDLTGKWTITKAGELTTDSVEQKPFINFTDSGTVHGNAAVNNFFGCYTAKGDSLYFDKLGTTMMMGPDMDVETAVVKALNESKTAELNGNTLTVKDAAGNALMTMERN